VSGVNQTTIVDPLQEKILAIKNQVRGGNRNPPTNAANLKERLQTQRDNMQQQLMQ
jgi:hypothetical protein